MNDVESASGSQARPPRVPLRWRDVWWPKPIGWRILMGLVKLVLCAALVFVLLLAKAIILLLIAGGGPLLPGRGGLPLIPFLVSVYLMFFFRRPWPYDERCPFKRLEPVERNERYRQL